MTQALEHGLAPLQQGMLYHELAAPSQGLHIEQIVVEFAEPVDPDLLQQAWQLYSQHCPQMRISLAWKDATPSQVTHPTIEVNWRTLDWRVKTSDDALADFLHTDRQLGIRLDSAPLFRLTLAQHDPEHWTLIWTFHHVLMDGRSFPLVLSDVLDGYDALRNAGSVKFPNRPAYTNYLDWLAGLDVAAGRSYWKKQFQDVQAPTSLDGFLQSRRGATQRAEVRGGISAHQTEKLRALAQSQGATLGDVLQLAWAYLLSRHTDEDSVIFGSIRAGRKQTIEAADEIIGLFINSLPVRCKLPRDISVLDALSELRQQSLTIRDFEQTPLVDIQHATQLEPGVPLYDSLIVFDREHLNSTMQELGTQHKQRRFELIELTSHPLTLYGYGEQSLWYRLVYNGAVVSEKTAEAILQRLHCILDGLTASSADTRLWSVPYLPEVERTALLQQFNNTALDYPKQARDSIISEFIAQAQRSPQLPALRYNRMELTYQQLEEQTAVLAQGLLADGAQAGDLIGLCMERSEEVVIAMLAIMRAGCAYVPLDPHYPLARLRYVLDDAKLQRVLVGEQQRTHFREGDAQCLTLDMLAERGTNKQPLVLPNINSQAYVIYTSGSTGNPEGRVSYPSQRTQFLCWYGSTGGVRTW